jgi:hypothetical protein
VCEYLRSPRGHGFAQGADLADVTGLAEGDRLVEQHSRGIAGEIHVLNPHLGQPGVKNLVIGIAPPQPFVQADPRFLREAFLAAEQHPADPLAGVGLAASMAE